MKTPVKSVLYNYWLTSMCSTGIRHKGEGKSHPRRGRKPISDLNFGEVY